MDHIRNQQPTSNRTLVNEGIFEMNSSVRASERSRLSRVQHSKKKQTEQQRSYASVPQHQATGIRRSAIRAQVK